MDTTIATKLRAPFPTEVIGKLPRVICKACSNSQSGVCGDHQKERCTDCGNYISTRHIHLDYVGHADVTARLLEADPAWTWEPAAVDEHGLPLCDTDDHNRPVGMWIKLTVAGVTRLGYGSCPSNQSDAVKVLIGDALRNAAMRFGVAVDLWAKGDRADPSAENSTASPDQAARRQTRPKTPPRVSPISAARAELVQVAKEKGLGADPATIGQAFAEHTGKAVADASLEDVKGFVEFLRTGVKPVADEAVPA